MAYSEEVLSRAEKALKARQEAHRSAQETRQAEIYAALPRTREIDRTLRQTAPKILAASLRQGGSPEAAITALRQENLALQQEEADLLTANGYPANALQTPPLCPLCQDRGWRGTAMCTCLRQLCQGEQIKELSSLLDLGEQSFDQFRLDYYDSQVWPEFHRSPRKNMELVLDQCRTFAQNFGRGPVKNLFLNGGPGLGKTFLSACIARTVSERGFSVVYDTAVTIFSRFETRKFARDGEETRQAQGDTRKYLACDLLILDDLGSEFTSPFVQAALYELLNTRLIQGKGTVISSNLNMEAIRQRYSPQAASRLEGEYRHLPFFGQDIRLLRKQTQKS